MKRPFGMTFSAIVLLAGSLIQVLAAFGMALSGAIMPPQSAVGAGMQRAPTPTWMPLLMYFMSAFVAGLAAWGIVTAIGLFRLRRWARYSVLVIGGCLAFFGLVSMLSTLVMTLVPLTPPPAADAAVLAAGQAHTVQIITRIMFVLIACFYGIMCAIGISWLVYFNRKTARDAFAGQIPDAVVEGAPTVLLIVSPGPRPILISVIAVLNMIGAVAVLMTMFLPVPALAFGFILQGWAKIATYLIYCCLQISVGIGLWQLREWSRRLMLGVLVLGVAQSAFCAFHPSLIVRYSAEVSKLVSPVPTPLPAHFQSVMLSVSFGFSVLFCIAIAAVLV